MSNRVPNERRGRFNGISDPPGGALSSAIQFSKINLYRRPPMLAQAVAAVKGRESPRKASFGLPFGGPFAAKAKEPISLTPRPQTVSVGKAVS
jgi:hypothetical protein